MLERLEMHDIQDKTRLLDEMNETRDGVNVVKAHIIQLVEELKKLAQKVDVHLKRLPKASKPMPKGRKSKPKTGPVNAKSYSPS